MNQQGKDSFFISFEIPVAPTAKARAKKYFNQKTQKMQSWTPAKTRNFENDVRDYALKFKPDQPLEIPLKVSVFFYIQKPKKPKFKYPATRPDLDNYLKSVLDGLNGIMFKDDNCVCEILTAKVYTQDYPKILVVVQEME